MSQSIPIPDVLSQVLEPFTDCLTPEAARRIVALQAAPDVQGHVDELADKANEGQLTADEQTEYDRYRSAFHFVTILQAKARAYLRRISAES